MFCSNKDKETFQGNYLELDLDRPDFPKEGRVSLMS